MAGWKLYKVKGVKKHLRLSPDHADALGAKEAKVETPSPDPVEPVVTEGPAQSTPDKSTAKKTAKRD